MHGGVSQYTPREEQIIRLERDAAELADPDGKVREAFERFRRETRQILERLLEQEGWPKQ